MISAQTHSAFVARENRCTLFRIMREIIETPNWPARANVPVGSARCRARPRPLDGSRDKVRAPNDRVAPLAIMPRIRIRKTRRKDQWMTAYLISLALAGFVGIAVWEALA
jgi:hypothetical protein